MQMSWDSGQQGKKKQRRIEPHKVCNYANEERSYKVCNYANEDCSYEVCNYANNFSNRVYFKNCTRRTDQQSSESARASYGQAEHARGLRVR